MNDILLALRAAGATIKGRKVVCPFHDDHAPSGSVYQGRDGAWRYKCFVCSWNRGRSTGSVRDVYRAIGEKPPDDMPRHAPPVSRSDTPIDWTHVWAQYSDNDLPELAGKLGLGYEAVRDMGYRSAGSQAWAIRVYGSDGTVQGVQLRNGTGRKWCLTGTRQGLFVPERQPENPKHLLVTEGASDAAYALSCGYAAVGRWAAGQSPDMATKWVACQPYLSIVVVADNDATGLESARAVARRVARIRARTARLIRPRGKDLRGWAPGSVALGNVIASTQPVR